MSENVGCSLHQTYCSSSDTGLAHCLQVCCSPRWVTLYTDGMGASVCICLTFLVNSQSMAMDRDRVIIRFIIRGWREGERERSVSQCFNMLKIFAFFNNLRFGCEGM